MRWNYLTSLIRNLKRNRGYTVINIAGLSIGLTAAIVIFLLITYELSFDKFHGKYNHIYRIVQDSKSSSGVSKHPVVPYPFAKAFRSDFDDVPLLTQFHYEGEIMVNVDGEKSMIDHVIFADSLFFQVFDFKILSGNPQRDLGLPGKAFLTKSLADKILRNDQQTTLKINNVTEVEIAGIIEDSPARSHLTFSMIVSFPSLSSDYIGGLPLDRWGLSASGFCYVALPEYVNPSSIEERLKSFVNKYHSEEDAARKTYRLQPLSSIHFSNEYANGLTDEGMDKADLFIMGILGTFIIIIACINFINLATAMAANRSREVGIRKTLGAQRVQVAVYFLGETFLLTLFACGVSLCLVEWLLSWLNPFLEKQLTLNFIVTPALPLFLLCLVLFVAIVSGLYPSLILSGFTPAQVLKNKSAVNSHTGALLRKVLVVFQFLIAQALIMGTLVISDQISYFRDKPLGFDKDAVITVEMPEKTDALMSAFRTRLEANADILDISFCVGAPVTDNEVFTGFGLSEKPDERHRVSMKIADEHFLNTYGLKLKSGRWFTENDARAVQLTADLTLAPNDAQYTYVINESAMKQLGFNDPEEVIGKNITTGIMDIQGEVIGVVEDFHTSTLHDEIPPVVLMNFPYFYYYAGIKMSPENISRTLKFVEKTWSGIYPDNYFKYEFFDDKLEKLYRKEEQTLTLFRVFSGISIFIGCLGLYGLMSFMANQRIREVGIRKVLGASPLGIVLLFAREFVKLILLAFVIASPLAWYFMNKWLQGFEYHVNIHWMTFAFGIGFTLVISLLTVGYRSWTAAMTNPALTLRNE